MRHPAIGSHYVGYTASNPIPQYTAQLSVHGNDNYTTAFTLPPGTYITTAVYSGDFNNSNTTSKFYVFETQ
jgi:hypothetical protein